MADIPDELDGVVDDLAGLENGLQLGGLILVNKVFIEIEAGGGEQGAGIIMEVGRKPLSFFLLQFDRRVKQYFLLLLFHLLEAGLVTHHFPLVEDDEDDKADGKYNHTQGTQE